MESAATSNGRDIEIWGGVECTVVRLRDGYRDQLSLNGHASRLDDLDRFAELGISAIRYPALWERTSPSGLQSADWSWLDARLDRLRSLGLRVVAGLVHHGSGPRDASLITDRFAPGLAEYAEAFADRYPWIDDYTPVNEPLTTARFSGLYGHWYPHGNDDRTFARALVNECRAVVLAMQAIRRVNPSARLVQTEDLGKTHSSRLLRYQARWENERRWMSLDLLTGRLRPKDAMWRYLLGAGIELPELKWFRDNPCPPDVLGFNYYVTSERYLSEWLDDYPAWSHGGNGRHNYADVEAVRGRPKSSAGIESLLTEAWKRYRLPLAVTEVQLGGGREAQLAWLVDTYSAAQQLRTQGVDIRAVTAWSLLGAYDWNSLLTRNDNFYESGAFDVRSGKPRPTALASALQTIARGEKPRHPVLGNAPWWKLPTRLIFGARSRRASLDSLATKSLRARPILIAGAAGKLGHAFSSVCRHRGIAEYSATRSQLDICDASAIRRLLQKVKPWAVVNAAGFVSVDEAEVEPQRCQLVNSLGPEILAAACGEVGIQLVTFSSALVFDGSQHHPYEENDVARPLSAYGRSKLDAEQRVLAISPAALILRTSNLFGPWDSSNFLYSLLQTLAARRPLRAAGDQIVSATYLPDLVHTCIDLLIDGESGVWHLANTGAIAWASLARDAARVARLDTGLIEECPACELGWKAPRPMYSVLGSARGQMLPSLENALRRFHCESEANWRCAQI